MYKKYYRLFLLAASISLLSGLHTAYASGKLLFYTLTNDQYTQMCLDLRGPSNSNGTLIQMWECIDKATQTNQQWWLNYVGSGRYQIQSAYNDKCLDIDNSSGINTSSRIQQWDCLGASQLNQLWEIEGDLYEDEIAFRSAADPSLCLVSHRSGLSYNGVPTALGVCEYEDPPGFHVQLAIGQAILIRSAHSGKCVEVDNAGGGTQNGANVQQWSCLGWDPDHYNQQWYVLDSGFNSSDLSFVGARRFMALHSGRCMAASVYSRNNGVNIRQWLPCDYLSEFYLRGAGDNRFILLTHNSVYPAEECLDLDSSTGGVQNGNNIQQWDCHYGSNQQWGFYRK